MTLIVKGRNQFGERITEELNDEAMARTAISPPVIFGWDPARIGNTGVCACRYDNGQLVITEIEHNPPPQGAP